MSVFTYCSLCKECALSIFCFIDWPAVEHFFYLLFNSLPDAKRSPLKILKNTILSNEDFQELDSMISLLCEHDIIKKKIITFLIIKLCYCGHHSGMKNLYRNIETLQRPIKRCLTLTNTITGE